MLVLLFGVILFQTVIAVDLKEFLNKSPERITNEDVSKLLVAIQNSDTPDEDLAEFKAFLVKNAQSSEERQVIESMSDLLKGIISAKQVMGLDSQLYSAESFEELSKLFNPNERKDSSGTEWKLDAELFDQQVQEFIAALPKKKSPTSDERKYRLVKVEAEEKEEEAHRLALNYYKTLHSNDEQPSYVTDEIIQIVLKAAKSEEFADVEEEKAANELREAISLLEKGLKKVHTSENEDIKEKEKESTEHQYDIDDIGRKYKLIKLGEHELEENAQRITLNYYNSLFPNEDRPTVVTDEINEKLFAAVKSIDISNHRKTQAQNEFQEELKLHQQALRKEYLADDGSLELEQLENSAKMEKRNYDSDAHV